MKFDILLLIIIFLGTFSYDLLPPKVHQFGKFDGSLR